MSSFNKRVLAREYAFKFLYHLQFPIFEQIKKDLIDSSLTDSIALSNALDDFNTSYLPNDKAFDKLAQVSSLDSPTYNFAVSIIFGVLKFNDSILETIKKALTRRKLETIDKIDLSIIMVGTFELLHTPETPKKVAINEAINIAKKYGHKDSKSFVNGVLDNIAKGIS